MAANDTTSLLLVGAGLQSACIALAALEADPEAALVLLDRDDQPCGNHTWSFHESDVPASLRGLVDGLPLHRWDGYDVVFPDRERHVGIGYRSLESQDLARVLMQRLDAAPYAHLLTGADVTNLDAGGVTLRDGRRLEAELVIDARGPQRDPDTRCGYQKFVGLELSLDQPHGLERPLLMDATVEQIDGFRFLYVLPLGPTRLLVEDTVFSTSSDLDVASWRERVLAEARARGWNADDTLREEHGVLPMPWTGNGPALQESGPLLAGYRGGFFHPATGYSVPQVLQVAALIAGSLDDPAGLFQCQAYVEYVEAHRRQTRFARFLNRLLFTGVAPDTRWTVFSRFYGHPEALISRFYACGLKRADRARMLVGRPPRGFSIRSALLGSAMQ